MLPCVIVGGDGVSLHRKRACQADKRACKPICRAWALTYTQIQAQAQTSPLAQAQARFASRKVKSRSPAASRAISALAALEKEAAILPAQLRIEREALLAVSQYLTLPDTHRMRTLLHDAIAAAPKNPKLASMLHFVERIPEVKWPPSVPAHGQRLRARGTARTTDGSECADSIFDSSLGMEPILPVYAAPWSPPLPVTSVILAKEEALRALEIALDDSRRYRATWFTDGSLLDGKAGGAAVRVENGMVREKIVVPLGDGQVCEGEMEGLLRATEKALRDDQDNILCVADSQAALRGTLLTTPRSGQFRAIRYDTLIRQALSSRPHLAVLNLWTPAHIGTIGNELADAAAKEATNLAPDPTNFVSLTSTRRLIHLQILNQWDRASKHAKTGGELKRIDRSPPSLNPIPLYSSLTIARKNSSIISQLRTGPSHLNASRFKSGFISSPACDACGAAYETRAHFLLECQAWEPLRKPLHSAAKEAGLFGPLHVSPLLCEPKLLRAVSNFVEATGRFP
ncbi:reverse transcriptase [Mycena venus]|uniref:Reverse transcriptase n=1 Tax=Mycena venus TaxID=2733690 RepID=A0A8H6ZAL8_9AGAR|nr:reverse transcriptase [Mycena venus]